MRRNPPGRRVKVTVQVPAPMLDEIDETATVEHRSRSAMTEVLLSEALAARPRPAEFDQDGLAPRPEGDDPGRARADALSVSGAAGALRP